MSLTKSPVKLSNLFKYYYKNGFKFTSLKQNNQEQFILTFQPYKDDSSQPVHDELIDDLYTIGLFKNCNLNLVNHQHELIFNGPLFSSHLLSSFKNQSSLMQFASNLLYDDEKKNILIEYSSPNIAKPFHYGHFKSTILGQFISNLLEILGHNVTRLNYLGDCGTQFGLLLLGYIKFGDENKFNQNPLSHLLEVYIKSNNEQEKNLLWRDEAKKIAKKLEEQSDNSIIENWQKFVQISISELKVTYSRLGINFNDIHRESMYLNSARKLIEILYSSNLLHVCEDGAKMFSFTLPGGEKKKIPLEKSDGTSLYLTRDVCAAIDRKEKYNFDQLYYVVDQGQSLHFENLKSVLKALSYSWFDEIRHVPFGQISGMSTRKGQAALLSDILNEAKSLAMKKLVSNKSKCYFTCNG